MDVGTLDSTAITFRDIKYAFPHNILIKTTITILGIQLQNSDNFKKNYHLAHTMCYYTTQNEAGLFTTAVLYLETVSLVYILPVPSCLEGFWAVLSFEADWLSAQPMSSLHPCTSLYTSIGWRL